MSMPEDAATGTIRYTVKELLAEIRDGISAIKNTQQSHERRIVQLEEASKRNTEAIEKRLEPGLSELVELASINAALNKSIEERAERGFTRREKFFALLIGLATVGISAASLLIHH